MKILGLLITLFFSVSCYSSFGQEHVIDTLYVESVDFNILTFSSVSCGSFATNFKERIRFRTILDKDTIGVIDSFLREVRYSKRDRDVDVRAKFIFERIDKSTITICTNGYEILVDNRLIKLNSKFAVFLKNLTAQSGHKP
jgi:hypothetical protein